MERHNTHILSDSEEEDDADENNHLYYFNDSNSNSESNSDKNTIYSNTKKTDPFKIDDLKSNDNCKKEIMDESLISISMLRISFNIYTFQRHSWTHIFTCTTTSTIVCINYRILVSAVLYPLNTFLRTGFLTDTALLLLCRQTILLNPYGMSYYYLFFPFCRINL